jgi:hypothetical protein
VGLDPVVRIERARQNDDEAFVGIQERPPSEFSAQEAEECKKQQ